MEVRILPPELLVDAISLCKESLPMSRKYTKEVLQPLVETSNSIAEVIRKLGVKWSGGIQALIVRRAKEYGIDTSHMLGQSIWKGKPSYNKKKPETVLRPRYDRREKTTVLRRAMVESGMNYECSVCGLGTEWEGRVLVLQVDHINGDPLDNRKENLRFMCPNCHSQTSTFGNKRRSDGVTGSTRTVESRVAERP